MGNTSSDEHARRSAELQLLLDEAGGKSTAPSGRDGTASGPGSPSPHRSPLRSSPSSTFPRRVTPAVPKATATPDAERQQRVAANGDPSARLRRSAMVRSSTAGARRPRADRNTDPAAESGRPRGSATPGTGARAGRGVPPSTKTAVARSLAGRWGPAGFTPAQPEHREVNAPVAPPVPDGVPHSLASVTATDSGRTVPVAQQAPDPDPAITTGRPATSLPVTVRPRQRRTLVLAGGVAAAVVAIVAVVSLGNRGGSGPAADAAPIPERIVMVESTGVDAEPTVTTVTAQVSTVNGTVVALVPDATGRVRQLTVVTATPPAGAAPRTSPTTAAPRSSSTAGAAAASANAASPGAASGAASPTATNGPGTTAPVTTPPATTEPAITDQPTNTAGQAPADPDDVATVVTGLTTLTGWVPVTTG